MPETPNNQTAKIKILVVDDEPYMHMLFKHHLERVGYQMFSAKNGGEAIEIATREIPHLIVMDIMMPGMDGITAAKHLKSNDATKGIPVIVVTANTHTISRQEAESSGATMFMTKPFSPAQLIAEIKRLIPEAGE